MVCLSIHVGGSTVWFVHPYMLEDLQYGLFVHTCWRIYSMVCLSIHVGGSTVWFVHPYMLEDLQYGLFVHTC